MNDSLTLTPFVRELMRDIWMNGFTAGCLAGALGFWLLSTLSTLLQRRPACTTATPDATQAS
jgi:hypothetical protein